MASQNNVFISCADTDCSTFLSSLKEALDSRGIDYSPVWLEHSLDITSDSSGDTSNLSVIIISEKYFSSKTNLHHLAKARNRRHAILPVFYHLHSSELGEDRRDFWTVFHQNTKEFGFSPDDVNACKAALKDACVGFGWDVPSDHDDERQVAENIADKIEDRIRSDRVFSSWASTNGNGTNGWSESSSNSSPSTNRRLVSMAAKALDLIKAAKAQALIKAAKVLELIKAEKIMFATIATNILVELVVLAVDIPPLSKKSPAVKPSLLVLSCLSFLSGVLELFNQIKRHGLLSQLTDFSMWIEFMASAGQLVTAVCEYCKNRQKWEDDFDPSSLWPIFFATLVGDFKIRRLCQELRTPKSGFRDECNDLRRRRK